jgi:hypothetical protein
MRSPSCRKMERQRPSGMEHKIPDGLQGIVYFVHNNASVSPCNGKPLASSQRLLSQMKPN